MWMNDGFCSSKRCVSAFVWNIWINITQWIKIPSKMAHFSGSWPLLATANATAGGETPPTDSELSTRVPRGAGISGGWKLHHGWGWDSTPMVFGCQHDSTKMRMFEIISFANRLMWEEGLNHRPGRPMKQIRVSVRCYPSSNEPNAWKSDWTLGLKLTTYWCEW